MYQPVLDKTEYNLACLGHSKIFKNSVTTHSDLGCYVNLYFVPHVRIKSTQKTDYILSKVPQMSL